MSFEEIKNALNDFLILRKNNIALVDAVDEKKLLIIPRGFANNIYWQAGHLLTVQVSLLYRRTNQPLPIDEKYFKYFAKGTSPSDFDDDIPLFSEVRNHLESLMEYTSSHINETAGLAYDEEITVSTGHKIKTFEDALKFLPIHEAVHNGSMTMMKKFF